MCNTNECPQSDCSSGGERGKQTIARNIANMRIHLGRLSVALTQYKIREGKKVCRMVRECHNTEVALNKFCCREMFLSLSVEKKKGKLLGCAGESVPSLTIHKTELAIALG